MSTRPLARTVHSSSQRTRMVTKPVRSACWRAAARSRVKAGARRSGAAAGRVTPAGSRPTKGAGPGAGAAAREAVDGAAERRGVDAPAAVLAEARHVRHGEGPACASCAAGSVAPEMVARAVVAVQVGAGELGQGDVAHHVAAGDRARRAVRVLDDRQDGARRSAAPARRPGRCAAPSYVVPAVVGAGAVARGGGEVDLLVAVLADVADDEVAGVAVEGEAPRVAQAVGEDRGAPVARIDAQELAEAVVVVDRRRRRVGGGAASWFCALPLGSPPLPPSPVPA